MATLNLDHEKVCYLIIKAREFDAKMEAEVPEPGDNPTDDDEREILFDYPDDPTVEEIRGFLATLNEDEVTELLALLWVGAGDSTSRSGRKRWPTPATTRTTGDRRRFSACRCLATFSRRGWRNSECPAPTWRWAGCTAASTI